MGGAKSGAHCKPLFKDLSILTIPCLYIYTVLLIIKSNIESILHRSDIHGYRTRGNQNLELPFHRLEISQHSVFYQGIRLFNSLHISVQNLPLSRFKSHIKSLLLQRACYSIQEFLECCEDWFCIVCISFVLFLFDFLYIVYYLGNKSLLLIIINMSDWVHTRMKLNHHTRNRTKCVVQDVDDSFEERIDYAIT